MELETITKIFAAPRRTVKYSFVINTVPANTLYETLYLKPNGNWSINEEDNNVANTAIFTIETVTEASPIGNIKVAKIKTATDLALVQNLPEILTFKIRALVPDKPVEFDDAVVTEIVFDLNIDSDNNNDLYDLPDHSEMEELLEDDDYALGTLILPGHESALFTPLRLYLLPGINPNDDTLKISFTYDFGHLGSAYIYTKNKGVANNVSIFSNVKYTLADLNYESTTGCITLYLSGNMPEPGYQTKTDVDGQLKAPSRKITATLFIDNQAILEDTVKYLVAKRDSYYYEHYRFNGIALNGIVRSALAANLIYGRETTFGKGSDSRFGLRLLDEMDLEKLSISLAVRTALTQANPVPGFNAGLYRDGVTGKFILAFAGTDDYEDVIEDIWQGLGNPLVQYQLAMEIANELKNLTSITDVGISITGHSLGGGLASAAYCVSDFQTYTFNAAGLHKKGLYKNNDPLDDERYEGSIARYDAAYGSSIPCGITAYYADYDILSFAQDNSPLPKALGWRRVLNSGRETELLLGTIVGGLVSLLPVPGAVLVGAAGAFAWRSQVMVDCHKMPAIYYGLLNPKGLYQ